MTNSLFGHLAMRFTSSPENLATEALSYILNTSLAANEAFSTLLGHLQVELPLALQYKTQGHGEHDSAIPDLVGIDAIGREELLGEAKFWAGLTDNQPVTYLKRLVQSGGKALIIFAPAVRFAYLWQELQYRCTKAGIALEPQPTSNPEITAARLPTGQTFILMSWRVLLDTIHQSLVSRGEMAMAGNVVQLQGLCEQMDTIAFLPLKSEELSSGVAKRYLQYCDLVDEVTAKLAAERFISLKGLRATSTRSGYTRYLNFKDHGGSIEVNYILWSKYRATPIWLGILSKDWKYDVEARKNLVSLEVENPSRLFVENPYLYVPLLLEPGMEKDELVAGMIKQIKEVCILLKMDESV